MSDLSSGGIAGIIIGILAIAIVVLIFIGWKRNWLGKIKAWRREKKGYNKIEETPAERVQGGRYSYGNRYPYGSRHPYSGYNGRNVYNGYDTNVNDPTI